MTMGETRYEFIILDIIAQIIKIKNSPRARIFFSMELRKELHVLAYGSNLENVIPKHY